jgi:transposase
MSKAYSSNLTQWQWELIESMIPAAKPGGRNREVELSDGQKSVRIIAKADE